MKEVICPICHKTYKLEDDEPIMYSICDFCFWEYDIDIDYSAPSEYSDPNHMTVGEAIKKAKNK